MRCGAFKLFIYVTDYLAGYSANNRSVICISCIDCIKMCQNEQTSDNTANVNAGTNDVTVVGTIGNLTVAHTNNTAEVTLCTNCTVVYTACDFTDCIACDTADTPSTLYATVVNTAVDNNIAITGCSLVCDTKDAADTGRACSNCTEVYTISNSYGTQFVNKI